MAQPQKLPFRYSTRQRTRNLGDFSVAFGDSISLELPRVGFLAGLHLTFASGIVRNTADSGAFSERVFNVLQRISINLNLGAASIVNISGFGLYTHNWTEKYNYGPDEGGSVGITASGAFNGSLVQDAHVYRGTGSDGYPFGTTAAASLAAPLGAPQAAAPFLLTYWIPIAANDGRNFNMGLINLQAPEVRATLDVQITSGIANMFVPGSVLTGTHLANNIAAVTVHMLFYEVPNPSRVLYPPLLVHRILEERQSFQNTGDIVYTVPRQGTVLRLHHNLFINGGNDGNPVLAQGPWMRFQTLRVNKTDDIYREFITFAKWHMRYRYGQKVPEGTYGWELWTAEEAPASGDLRDAIDSEAISTLESIITIADNAVLGTGNNFLDSIREIIQVLQV